MEIPIVHTNGEEVRVEWTSTGAEYVLFEEAVVLAEVLGVSLLDLAVPLAVAHRQAGVCDAQGSAPGHPRADY